MNKKSLLLGVLLIVIVGAGVYWYSTTHPKVVSAATVNINKSSLTTSSTTPTISGTAQGATQVLVQIESENIGAGSDGVMGSCTAQVSSGGAWSCRVVLAGKASILKSGNYAVTAVGLDVNGNYTLPLKEVLSISQNSSDASSDSTVALTITPVLPYNYTKQKYPYFEEGAAPLAVNFTANVPSSLLNKSYDIDHPDGHNQMYILDTGDGTTLVGSVLSTQGTIFKQYTYLFPGTYTAKLYLNSTNVGITQQEPLVTIANSTLIEQKAVLVKKSATVSSGSATFNSSSLVSASKATTTITGTFSGIKDICVVVAETNTELPYKILDAVGLYGNVYCSTGGPATPHLNVQGSVWSHTINSGLTTGPHSVGVYDAGTGVLIAKAILQINH
ncbi:MAG: hypothetical protein JWL75_273 [Parcubacteria group bacterium]|nr:hypothetical protein [Parcubacteria group bacterium]